MKKRRLFSIMAASVLAVSLLAGCGGKSATADGQTDKAEAQAQSGQSSEKKVLRVWLEKVFSDDANTFLQKRVEQYAQEKGVEVQFEFLSATDFVPKLNAAIEAGSNIPDIIPIFRTWTLRSWWMKSMKNVPILIPFMREPNMEE